MGQDCWKEFTKNVSVHELTLRNLHFDRQLIVPVVYKGVKMDCGYRLDLLVEGTVILELKSVDHVHPIFEAQLLSYMRLLGKTVGLLINFNVPVLKAGITRKVL